MDAAKGRHRACEDEGRAGIDGAARQRKDDARRPGCAMDDGRVDQVAAGLGHVALSSNAPRCRELEPGHTIARHRVALDVDGGGERTPGVPGRELALLQAAIVWVEEGA